MRKYLLPLVVFALLNSCIYAQGEWRQLVPMTAYNQYITSLATDTAGNIYFSDDGFSDPWIWDGNKYSQFNAPGGTIIADQFGNLYTYSGGNVYQRSGSTWMQLGSGSNALDAPYGINNITLDANGNLYVAALSIYDTAAIYANQNLNNLFVARWNGVNWIKSDTVTFSGQVLTGGYPVIMCADIYKNIYLAGIGHPGDNYNTYLAMWNGTSWTEPGAGNGAIALADGSPFSLFADAQGNVYAGGLLTDPNINSGVSFSVGKWNGSKWSALPNFGNDNHVYSICMDDTGYLYAVFYTVVAKWDGNQWIELGNGKANSGNLYGIINSICADHHGHIFAGGDFKDIHGHAYIAEYINLPSANMYVYLNATNANCSSPGSIKSEVSGGIPPYNYLWSNNSTLPNLPSLAGGNYSVTVTDSVGRQVFGSVTVGNSCQSFITGIAFNDVNGNCIFDSTDQLLPNVTVQVVAANGASSYTNTNSSGEYVVQVLDTGKCSLSVTGNTACGKVSICNYPTDTLEIPYVGDTISNVNIAISGSAFDLTLHCGWTSANPGFTKEYWIMPYNTSPFSDTGQVTIVFTYDSNLIYQSSLPPIPVVNTTAHTLTYVLDGDSIPYPYFNWNHERFISYFKVPSALSLNYQMQSDFVIEPNTGDCNPANNHLHFSDPITGSHDPNSKSVSPSGFISDGDSVFTYTINFQNTGTDSTNFVVVKDTLSPYLNPASVVNLASSANYAFNISGTGILTWTFNPLRLPYQSIDSVGSKGFIMFSAKIKEAFLTNTPMANSATIYFDYNPGITTNTVTDTICATSFSSFTATICRGDTFSFFGVGEVSGGDYSHTLQNINGCDSVVTVHLVVLGHDSSSLSASICAGDTFPFFGISETKAGDYIFKEPDSSGCYTVITLHLTVNPLPAPVLTAVDSIICPNDSTTIFASGIYTSYRWNTGATTTGLQVDTAGSYYVQVTDSNGCKGVSHSINIGMYPAQQYSWIVQGDTVTVFPFGVAYQWYYNGAIIPGADWNPYIICKYGNYTVQITDSNGCVWMVNVYVIVEGRGVERDCTIGLPQLDESNRLSVYPNPAINELLIKTENFLPQWLAIYDMDGRKVTGQHFTPQLDISALSPGLYFIEVKGEENVVVRKRFVKM